jgi:hypothetical protein
MVFTSELLAAGFPDLSFPDLSCLKAQKRGEMRGALKGSASSSASAMVFHGRDYYQAET